MVWRANRIELTPVRGKTVRSPAVPSVKLAGAGVDALIWRADLLEQRGHALGREEARGGDVCLADAGGEGVVQAR